MLNGCTDDTIGIVQRVAAEFPAAIRPLEFKEPIGKGGALIEGLKLASAADLIGYVDADGATPPHAFWSWSGTSAKRIVSSARAGCPARSFTNHRPATGNLPAACFISSCNVCSG